MRCKVSQRIEPSSQVTSAMSSAIFNETVLSAWCEQPIVKFGFTLAVCARSIALSRVRQCPARGGARADVRQPLTCEKDRNNVERLMVSWRRQARRSRVLDSGTLWSRRVLDHDSYAKIRCAGRLVWRVCSPQSEHNIDRHQPSAIVRHGYPIGDSALVREEFRRGCMEQWN